MVLYSPTSKTPFATAVDRQAALADTIFNREFVHTVSQHLTSMAGPGASCAYSMVDAPMTDRMVLIDDALSDDMTDGFAQSQLVLPPPDISNLEEIENAMRGVASSQQGRDALAKFVISEDYVRKLIPLVEIAEDLESIKDLHYLCNITKMIILLNDSQIIDHIVNEDVVMGVVGALECQSPRNKKAFCLYTDR